MNETYTYICNRGHEFTKQYEMSSAVCARCGEAAYLMPPEPDETIINRPAWFNSFIPVDLCKMCGGSLTDGVRRCACKVKSL